MNYQSEIGGRGGWEEDEGEYEEEEEEEVTRKEEKEWDKNIVNEPTRTKVKENLSENELLFRQRVQILQVEARQGLLSARSESKIKIEEKRRDRVVSPNLVSLLGIQTNTKLNRRMLSGLSLGQLQVILNDYLGRDSFRLNSIQFNTLKTYPIPSNQFQFKIISSENRS